MLKKTPHRFDCERCGEPPRGFVSHDYCDVCMRTLCGECMAMGCCSHVPAKSGMAADYQADEGPAAQPLH